MSVYLHCISHTPLYGLVDPSTVILNEVNNVVGAARERIAKFDPEIVILFSPDHYNGFFYDLMPSFCIGTAAESIGDFGTLSGRLNVPSVLAESCMDTVLSEGIDVAFSHKMQVDHGSAQPLEFLLGSLDRVPVIPIFINSVASPVPTFVRSRLFGEAVGKFARSLDKRVLIIGSGGLSHQPPVPELNTATAIIRENLLGRGRDLSREERAAREQRTINSAKIFTQNNRALHPLNPEWDNEFLDVMSSGDLALLDSVRNDEVSEKAGKSAHEVKNWHAAFAALSVFGDYQTSHRYYRPIHEWIAGYGSMSAEIK